MNNVSQNDGKMSSFVEVWQKVEKIPHLEVLNVYNILRIIGKKVFQWNGD